MIAVTGASGQLGRIVIENLLKTLPAKEVVAAVRSPDKVKDLAERGVVVRVADYTKPDTLRAAFEGVDRLVMISASEVGQRVAQHRNVIEAARAAGIGLVAYTSILRADTTPLGLGEEHRETEGMLKGSGLAHVILRNGWYTENRLMAVPAAVEGGVLYGAADEGRIASAARADYAAAAAKVMTSDGHEGKVYELAGDESYTLAEFAAELSRLTGKEIVYEDMPEAEYKAALERTGLPGAVAAMLADSDVGTAQGGLFDDGHQLSRLIGRPTRSWKEQLADSLGKG